MTVAKKIRSGPTIATRNRAGLRTLLGSQGLTWTPLPFPDKNLWIQEKMGFVNLLVLDAILCCGSGPKKNSVFGRFSFLPPCPSSLKNANCIFIVFSPSLGLARVLEVVLRSGSQKEPSVLPRRQEYASSESTSKPHRVCLNIFEKQNLEVFQRPLTLILLQKYRDTSGRRIVIQLGGVYTTFCPEKGILLQKYRDRNGRCIAILFKSIGVRGRFDFLGSRQKRPGANRPPEFVPESPLQKGVFGSHIFPKEL